MLYTIIGNNSKIAKAVHMACLLLTKPEIYQMSELNVFPI